VDLDGKMTMEEKTELLTKRLRMHGARFSTEIYTRGRVIEYHAFALLAA
jgi:hypothetical protein